MGTGEQRFKLKGGTLRKTGVFGSTSNWDILDEEGHVMTTFAYGDPCIDLPMVMAMMKVAQQKCDEARRKNNHVKVTDSRILACEFMGRARSA